MTQDQVSDGAIAADVMRKIAAFIGITLSATNRAERDMQELGTNRFEALQVLQTCDTARAVSGWPCWVYYGETLDGLKLGVVAILCIEVRTIKILRVWKAIG